MKYLALALALVTLSSQTMAAEASFEKRAVGKFLIDCVPALLKGDSVARVAEMQKNPRVPANAEAMFLQGRPGKAFWYPNLLGVVLTAPNEPSCSIMIKQMDSAEFIKQVDYWFSQKDTPWQLVSDKNLPGGEAERQYVAKINQVEITAVIRARDKASDQIQGMMTAARTAQ